MEFQAGISTIGMILIAMAVLALVEIVIPLRDRTTWSKRHILPNLAVTLLTFATNLLLNIPILLGLLWLEAKDYGLFNMFAINPAIQIVATVLVLDLAWYVTHVAMHKVPRFWQYHVVHHSDPFVDVTSTARQHPVESVVRYLFLAAFGFACGVSPAGFAAYKVWQILSGLMEHSNIRLPEWIDSAMTTMFSSPCMHKIHHSRDKRFTDSNFGNIFSVWDRLFGTFVPSHYGRQIDYGLDGFDGAPNQTAWGLLALPFLSDGGINKHLRAPNGYEAI